MRQEFNTKVRVAAFERCKGQCEGCGARLTVGRYAYDHIVPTSLGGPPTLDNCQVLCSGPGSCHARKTETQDVPRIAKTARQRAKHIGAKAPSRNPLPGGRGSAWKKTFSNGWV